MAAFGKDVRMGLLRSAADVAAFGVTAASAIVRSGALRPRMPRPALLAALLAAPRRGIHLGTAVALHAAGRPDGLAVVDDAGELTWSQLDHRVNRLANVLTQDGRVAGVGFLLRNGREAVETYLASFRAGVAAVPVNTWLPSDEIARILSRHDVSYVVVAEEFRSKVPDSMTALVVGPGGSYEAALADAAVEPPAVKGTGRIVTYTSGTTGGPKGAERSLSSSALGPGIRLLDKVPLRVDDVFVIAPPLFHMLAQGMLAGGAALGSTIVLPSRPDPEAIIGAAIRTEATALCLVPIMLRRLIETVEPGDLPHLRVVIVSGSALPSELRDEAQRKLGPVIYDIYGSTEVGWATISTPADHERKRGSVGKPSRGMQVSIVGDDGELLEAGQPGRILVRTGLEFTGYAEMGERDAGAIDLGDRGYLDEDGYLFVTGRSDDMVVTGGENVQPDDVEAVLDKHPEIVESAVVGVDDDEYGQVLAAYVVTADGAALTEDDVVAHAKDHLARYMVPRQVTFIDVLPRNATGKVVKRWLTEGRPDES